MEEIDIIGKKDVPQDYTTLIKIDNSVPDKSFETNASATSSGSSNAPIGGRKYNKRKTKRGRKTRKQRRNKSRKNKRR